MGKYWVLSEESRLIWPVPRIYLLTDSLNKYIFSTKRNYKNTLRGRTPFHTLSNQVNLPKLHIRPKQTTKHDGFEQDKALSTARKQQKHPHSFASFPA